jgi:hypothetical protein
MACADAACERFGWIAPGRLGILGGSYGGYMTSWTIVGHGLDGRGQAGGGERGQQFIQHCLVQPPAADPSWRHTSGSRVRTGRRGCRWSGRRPA